MAKILATLNEEEMNESDFERGFRRAEVLYRELLLNVLNQAEKIRSLEKEIFELNEEQEWERIKEEEQNDIYDNPRERNEYGEFEDED